MTLRDHQAFSDLRARFIAGGEFTFRTGSRGKSDGIVVVDVLPHDLAGHVGLGVQLNAKQEKTLRKNGPMAVQKAPFFRLCPDPIIELVDAKEGLGVLLLRPRREGEMVAATCRLEEGPWS